MGCACFFVKMLGSYSDLTTFIKLSNLEPCHIFSKNKRVDFEKEKVGLSLRRFKKKRQKMYRSIAQLVRVSP
jgi:hypothetical protein